MAQRITPVILSGGSGQRLWPLSTPLKPKQFLPLQGNQSLFQQAAMRVGDSAKFNAPIIVSNTKHIDLIEQQLSDINVTQYTIIVEPAGRNTAPAIALAALVSEHPETPLLVLPSDHVINDNAAFHAAIETALPHAMGKWLFTLGLKPDAPETGYGYLKMGERIADTDNAYALNSFIEKPDNIRAKEMLDSGGFLWNAGIFLMRADNFLSALQQHAPDIHRFCVESIKKGTRKGHCWFIDSATFEKCPSDSIDYAVMEKASHIATVPVSMGWSDLGNWNALYDISDADVDANVITGPANPIDTTGCYIRSDGPKISIFGMQDLIVISQGDDIVILPRSDAQMVKKLAE